MTEPAKRKLKLNTHRLSTDAELVTIAEASQRLGKGYSRRSIQHQAPRLILNLISDVQNAFIRWQRSRVHALSRVTANQMSKLYWQPRKLRQPRQHLHRAFTISAIRWSGFNYL
jgi:hypothetical protein